MGEVAFMPCLVRPAGGDGGDLITLGHPLLDAAYAANPARFGYRRPTPPKLPTVAWIASPHPRRSSDPNENLSQRA